MRGLGLVLAAFAGLAWGQGSGSLAGTVVDAITAVPLAGVRLQLNYREAETTTDEQGRFRFVGMKPGGHFLLTELAGYASQPRGDAAIALSDGEKVEGMRVRLAPEAVVRGRVLDEYGRPIPARVAVTRQEPQVHVADVFSKTGEYEVRGLPAGAYRISVERTVGQPGPVLRTYDPGRHYAGSAENVQLGSGEHRLGLDIVSRPSPAFVAVRGRFLGSAPVGERLQLTRLNRKGGSMLLAPSGMLSESGRFVIGLAPGDYVLQVLGQPTGPGRMKILGKATISVPETEMSEEVQIRPVPLHTVRARARWVDGRRPPPPVSSFVLNPPELQGFLTWGKLQQDGSLAATEVSVGVYSALPGGLAKSSFVRAVLAGGVDVTKNGVELGEGTTPEVTFVVDDRGATVAGELVDERGQPTVGGEYLMSLSNGTLYERQLRVRSGYADARGRFTIEGLAPGEYELRAWLGGKPTETRRVTVRPSGRTQVRLVLQ